MKKRVSGIAITAFVISHLFSQTIKSGEENLFIKRELTQQFISPQQIVKTGNDSYFIDFVHLMLNLISN